MEHKINVDKLNSGMDGEEEGYGSNVNVGGAVPIHIQVTKIKQEFEKVKHPSLLLEQPAEMRRVLLREFNRQRSRSPLGLAATV